MMFTVTLGTVDVEYTYEVSAASAFYAILNAKGKLIDEYPHFTGKIISIKAVPC